MDHSMRLASWASIFNRRFALTSAISPILMRIASRTCIPEAGNHQGAQDREGNDAGRPHPPPPGLEHPAEAETGESRGDVLHAVKHPGGGGRGFLAAEVRGGGAGK